MIKTIMVHASVVWWIARMQGSVIDPTVVKDSVKEEFNNGIAL